VGGSRKIVSILATLIAFTVVGAVITISPGPDSLLVLRTAVVAGPAKALAAAAGICTGLLAWALAAAFGREPEESSAGKIFDSR